MSKGLEALKELLKNHPYHEEDCDRVVIIEKELKALEIIKEKLSSLTRYTFLPMTQEQFELLEEVLL